MTCRILLITHPNIGAVILQLATQLFPTDALPIELFEVPLDSNLSELLPKAVSLLKQLDQGGGVLILTDLYGASPSNLAAQLVNHGVSIRRVAGLNLPMLLRVINYSHLDLNELAATAAAGTCKGVIIDDA